MVLCEKIHLNDLQNLEKLGSGNYSEVCKATTADKKQIAVKQFRKQAEFKPEEFKAALSLLQHENILEVYECQNGELGFYILMEYADCGSLHYYLHDCSQIYTFDKCLNWLQQCAKGLTHLHRFQILHKNLKSENLQFFNNYQTLKISDVDPFTNKSDGEMDFEEQVQYCEPCCAHIDVFSFGNVIWEVLSRKKPKCYLELPYHSKANIWPHDSFIVDHENLDEIKSLIKMCFDLDLDRRPKMKVLSTFISGLYQQKLSNKSAGLLNWNDFKLIKTTGFGAFGEVFQAVWNTEDGDRKIAVKKIRDTNEKIEREVKYLSLADHENIIKLYGSAKVDDDTTVIVMEYADCGSLYNFLHGESRENQERKVSILGKLNWMLQCSKGIAYLHEQNPKILHRDLKSQNLLLFNGNRTLKICDFGTVRTQKTLMTNAVGTAGYMAPEVCSNFSYTEKCDVYSFGILCWEILSEKMPFYHVEHQRSLVIMNLASQKKNRPPINDVKIDDKSKYLKKLIQQCWDKNPEKRPTMKRLVVVLSIDPKSSALLNIHPLPEASEEDYTLVPTNRMQV